VLSVYGRPRGTVGILLGNGDGTFQPTQYFSVGNLPQSVAVGDFNGDGIPDLSVANSGLGLFLASSVSILLGQGDGTFTLHQEMAHGRGLPWSILAVELNGDNQMDIVTADVGLGKISVWLGQGDGSFQLPQSFQVAPFPQMLAAGDFNGDNWLDVAVAAGGIGLAAGEVSILTGEREGSVSADTKFCGRKQCVCHQRW